MKLFSLISNRPFSRQQLNSRKFGINGWWKVDNDSSFIIVKNLIDQLAVVENAVGSTAEMGWLPLTLVVGYGVSRATASGMQELRNAIFAHVAHLK